MFLSYMEYRENMFERLLQIPDRIDRFRRTAIVGDQYF